MAIVQIGLVTWLVALITIELALTHASVWRVSHPWPLHLHCLTLRMPWVLRRVSER